MALRTTNGERGFTLIELMVVLAIIAILMTLVVPNYLHQYHHSRETVLRMDLRTLRKSLDNYAADNGHGPEALDELVKKKYLQAIPVDPITGKDDSWQVVTDDDRKIVDVHSGAPGKADDGTEYAKW